MPFHHNLFACLVAVSLAGAPMVASAAPPQTAASARVDRSPDPEAEAADHPDSARYAELEAESPEAAEFEGGHRAGVVVGGTTLAVVLLVVLILVLL